jgi:hypothetical protein
MDLIARGEVDPQVSYGKYPIVSIVAVIGAVLWLFVNPDKPLELSQSQLHR